MKIQDRRLYTTTHDEGDGSIVSSAPESVGTQSFRFNPITPFPPLPVLHFQSVTLTSPATFPHQPSHSFSVSHNLILLLDNPRSSNVPVAITLSPPGRRVVQPGADPRQRRLDSARLFALARVASPRWHIVGGRESEKRRGARVPVFLDAQFGVLFSAEA